MRNPRDFGKALAIVASGDEPGPITVTDASPVGGRPVRADCPRGGDAGWASQTWTWTGVAGIVGVVVLMAFGNLRGGGEHRIDRGLAEVHRRTVVERRGQVELHAARGRVPDGIADVCVGRQRRPSQHLQHEFLAHGRLGTAVARLMNAHRATELCWVIHSPM